MLFCAENMLEKVPIVFCNGATCVYIVFPHSEDVPKITVLQKSLAFQNIGEHVDVTFWACWCLPLHAGKHSPAKAGVTTAVAGRGETDKQC